MAHLTGIPPESRLRQRVLYRQGPLKPAWIGDDMEKFGQHLRRKGEFFACIEDLALQQSRSTIMLRGLADFEVY